MDKLVVYGTMEAVTVTIGAEGLDCPPSSAVVTYLNDHEGNDVVQLVSDHVGEIPVGAEVRITVEVMT